MINNRPLASRPLTRLIAKTTPNQTISQTGPLTRSIITKRIAAKSNTTSLQQNIPVNTVKPTITVKPPTIAVKPTAIAVKPLVTTVNMVKSPPEKETVQDNDATIKVIEPPKRRGCNCGKKRGFLNT